MKNIYLLLFICLFIFSPDAFSQRIEITQVDFNSNNDDFASCLTRHGRFIYFTSDRSRSKQNIFVVERTTDGWSFPEKLGSDINDGKQNGTVAMTPDGQFMIFAAFKHGVDGEGRTDLYSAERVDGEWTNVLNLGPAVNSEYWDSQPTLSSDGTTLYFVSDRPDGIGGTDIYMSTFTRNGWSKAKNLSSSINTANDEMSPIINDDNKSFSFASNRPGGLGAFDIYISKLSDAGFSTPKNAGTPINTAADEFFYVNLSNSDIAYFSSNRSGGTGELDIYRAVPNPYPSDAVVLVKGIVMDKETKEPLGSRIVVTDLRTNKKVSDMRSDDITGDYFVVLQPGRNYSITAYKKGYVFYSERFEVPPTDQGREETKDIYLSKDETRLLVYFDFNKFSLQDESIPELERVIEFMRENSDINIILEGHTDDVGGDEYNDKLSLNRANSVMEYLKSGGIDTERIKTKGFGKRKPLVEDTSDEARAMNRRVEMRVIK